MGDDVPIYVTDSDDSDVSDSEGDNNLPELSDEQSRALDAAKEGRSIFITGSAGVGKSFLLKEILKILPQNSTYVTASTGVAACNIGGTTLHSFAGIGLGDKSANVLADNINCNKSKNEPKKRWLSCRVLVIDEISMIDGTLFEKVEKVAKIVRKNAKPFGGIQVILCGDFLQLPPVKSKFFAFQTKSWSEVVEETIVLKKVFRQKDIGVVTLLNRLRTGQFTKLDVEVLDTCRNTKFIDDGILATRLFPHRYSCENLNNAELKKLKGSPVIYAASDHAVKQMYHEMLEKNSKFPSRLELKTGAQVMLLVNKNVKGHLVNGARGVVIGFRNRSISLGEDLSNIMLKCKEDDNLGALKGKNLLQDTIIISEDEGGESSDDDVDQDDDNFVSFKRSPIVLFACSVVDVVTEERLTIAAGGRTVASRTQIPLALAWAVSVHKSQGMTLDRIEVNIAESFEHGQSYVALSRVTSLEGLLLRDFNASKITAHPKVLSYYKKIDPTFDKFTIEGDDELKAFVEGKKKLEGYEEILKQIKERNEAVPCCSSSKDKISLSPGATIARNLDLKNSSSPSDFPPFVSKTQTGTDGKLLNDINKNGLTGTNINIDPPCTSTSTDHFNTEEVGVIGGDIKVEGIFSKPLDTTCKALLRAESVLADCRRAIDEAKAGPSNFFANEDVCVENPQKTSEKSSIVVDGDSDDHAYTGHNEVDIREFDAEIFEKDDFEEGLLQDSTSCAPNNFLDKICPDLLESTDSLTRDTVLHHISKRKRTEKESESKSPKKNNPLVEHDSDQMARLLKAKAIEIEMKKKAALERRRSLQRLHK